MGTRQPCRHSMQQFSQHVLVGYRPRCRGRRMHNTLLRIHPGTRVGGRGERRAGPYRGFEERKRFGSLGRNPHPRQTNSDAPAVTSGDAHATVNHVDEYVRGQIDTQGIENSWSLLNAAWRALLCGCRTFHLDRYVAEQVSV